MENNWVFIGNDKSQVSSKKKKKILENVCLPWVWQLPDKGVYETDDLSSFLMFHNETCKHLEDLQD